MEFTNLKLPPSLDPRLITWTVGRRRPSKFCALCGAPIGDIGGEDEDGELLLWKEDGSCARFCVQCVALHWGMRTEPIRDELPAPKTQPGVGADLVRWDHPGHCPDCGGSELTLGPRGGIAVNRRCRRCGAEWNTVWRQSIGLGLIERIRPSWWPDDKESP